MNGQRYREIMRDLYVRSLNEDMGMILAWYVDLEVMYQIALMVAETYKQPAMDFESLEALGFNQLGIIYRAPIFRISPAIGEDVLIIGVSESNTFYKYYFDGQIQIVRPPSEGGTPVAAAREEGL